MAMKRVVVTGATGFLGRHLCRMLETRGWEVHPVGRTTRFAFVANGLSDFSVVHLAAQTEVGRARGNPLETYEGNIGGTLEVLEACREHPANRIIIASSDKVYGELSLAHKWYREDDPLAAGGPYETSKACADLIAQSYQKTYGLPVVITRCANLYGPGHLNWSTLIPGTIRSVLEGNRPVLRSTGEDIRSWLYVKDAVGGYMKLLEADKASGAYNFGTGSALTVLNTVNLILELMNSSLTPDIQGTARGELTRQVVGIERASDLGWHPEWYLRDGLTETIEWYRNYFDARKP